MGLEEGGTEHGAGGEEHEGAEGADGDELANVEEDADETGGDDNEEPAAEVKELAHVHVLNDHHTPEEADGEEDDAPGVVAGEVAEEGLGLGGFQVSPEMGGEQDETEENARPFERDTTVGGEVVEVVVELFDHGCGGMVDCGMQIGDCGLRNPWALGELEAFEEVGDGELEGDVEVAEFGVDGGDFVEAHFVDDAFDLEEVVGEESDTPLVGIEAGGAGDELADFAGVFAAGAGVAAHEFAAFVEVERPPVGADVAVFVHGVEADDRPIREVGIEAVVVVLFHVGAPFFEPSSVGVGADFEIFGAGDAGGGVFFFFGVFGPLGHGEVAVGGAEDIGTEAEGELFFEAVGVVEVSGDEHETEVGFGSEDAEGEELGFVVGADGLEGLGETGEALAFFVLGEGGPEAVVDVIEEVLDEPAFFSDEGGRGGGFGGGGEGSGGHGMEVGENFWAGGTGEDELSGAISHCNR